LLAIGIGNDDLSTTLPSPSYRRASAQVLAPDETSQHEIHKHRADYSSAVVRLLRARQTERRRRRREFNPKILRGKPTRCRVIPGRPALLAWRGRPSPSRTAPLGMTKTPTRDACVSCTQSVTRRRKEEDPARQTPRLSCHSPPGAPNIQLRAGQNKFGRVTIFLF